MPTDFELEMQEQHQLEKDYADWCRKFDPNYIVESDVDEEPNDSQTNQTG